MGLLSSPPALLVAGIALAGLYFYIYRRLQWLRYRQFSMWPQTQSSLLFGHAALIGQRKEKMAPSSHPDYVFRQIHQELDCPPIYMTDLRPFSMPMLVVGSHEIAEQLSRNSKLFPWSAPKSPTLKELSQLMGQESLLSHEGETWKALRRRFNPGFATKHLLSLLPCILDKTDIFLEHLDRFAQTGEEFLFNELTTNLTFDIIGAVVLDADLDAQYGDARRHPIVKEFIAMAYTFLDPLPGGLDRFSPTTQYKRFTISRRLDSHIKQHIRETFARQRSSGKSSRSVLSLSLQGMSTLGEADVSLICDQLKTFLFAGHDTTSITLQWALYELSRTPSALAAIRAELDEVFGDDPNPAVVREKLLAPGGEELLSRLPYTSAVMKETLRLYPPAGTARYIPPGSNLRLALPGGGESPCVDGLILYSCHHIIQRDKTVYGENADLFAPERWLIAGDVDTSMAAGNRDYNPGADKGGGEKGIPNSAWRPFERGQRNCIGQELANIETRVILAACVRRFDFEKIGLGALLVDRSGQHVVDGHGQYQVTAPLYNTSKVTGQPVDGTRMKVRLSERARAGVRK